MKGRRKLAAVCMAAILLLCGTLLVMRIVKPLLHYTCLVEEDLFSIGMEKMNGALTENFSLHAGDAIDVSVVRVDGEIGLRIAGMDGVPIYEGRNPMAESFRVGIPEDGDYAITVTGKQAEGSAAFQMVRSGEQQ